jgi:pSer/pThr/pTyr-binding forkhead associated (FHA) protein
MECGKCKAQIDDDSYFCDQCAVELFRCIGCGQLGSGKRCKHDGKPLVSLRGGEPQQSAPTPAAGAAALVAGNVALPAASSQKLRLVSADHRVDLRPASGDLLGRAAGPHAGVLCAFEHVSSRHACVRRDANGNWCIEDLGSTNGTFLNGGTRLPARVEHALPAGAKLKLGSLDLKVEFE